MTIDAECTRARVCVCVCAWWGLFRKLALVNDHRNKNGDVVPLAPLPLEQVVLRTLLKRGEGDAADGTAVGGLHQQRRQRLEELCNLCARLLINFRDPGL